MRPFSWILLTIPVYLLVNGRLLAYVKLASTKNATTGQQASPDTTLNNWLTNNLGLSNQYLGRNVF